MAKPSLKIKISFKLRNTTISDKQDLFLWRNHPDIRRNSLNMSKLSWEEHNRWFDEKIKDINTKSYIAYCDIDKIGTIRFEIKKDHIRTSVMLNPAFIGKGFGSKLIRRGIDKYIRETKPDRPIIAEIKKSNVASMKAFEKSGFIESHIVYVFKT
jgi:RimJ/RimL family protein N-acetyltransferase